MGIYHVNLGAERIGQISYDKYGSAMRVIEYKTANDLTVEFVESGSIVHTTWRNFQAGVVKDPMAKSVYGMGVYGIGPYSSHEHPGAYRKWFDMLRRCYDPKWSKRGDAYKDVHVCEEWLNFQNFAAWYYDNIPDLTNDYELDKDVLGGFGTKLYCPDNCSLIPQRINTMISLKEKIRGEYPVGVTKDAQCGSKFRARLTDRYKKANGTIWLLNELYDTVAEASQAYNNAKEKYVHEVAEEYRDQLSQRTYDALRRWQVPEETNRGTVNSA